MIIMCLIFLNVLIESIILHNATFIINKKNTDLMTVFVFNQHLIKHGRGCVHFTRLTSNRQ